jgi:RHS repeat-associated protein
VSETRSDLLGRTLRTIQNYTGQGDFGLSGVPLETDTAQDLTTDYQYDSSGRMVTMTVYDAKGAGGGVEAEQTKYLYGSPIDGSLQTGEVDPDSTDSLAQDATTLDWSITSGTDHTSSSYNLDGGTATTTDQRGVVHTYFYDAAGQLMEDEVTSFGSSGQNVDQTVNAIVTTYDDVGRVVAVSSEGLVGSTETILNQVQYQYDGWGNLVQEWQSQNGPVDTSSTPPTPSVQYQYDDGAGAEEGTGVAASYVRLTDLIYPNGRDVQYGYGTAGAVDDIMSRIESISDLSGGLASYDYLGAGTVASVSYPQPALSLDYSADNFAAWDQFGEVLNQAWKEGSTTVDGYSYTYDQSGNRLTRANLTDAVLSESYTYDGLDRLTSVTRNGTQTESWTLDSLGNFMGYTTPSVSQSRITDQANEITSITQGTTQDTQGYDLAGNMTTIADPNNPNGTLTCTFDAWNRLTEVQDSSGNIIAQYQYDGTGRLVEELSDFSGSLPGTVTYSFYDGQNAIETRTGTVSGNSIPAASTLSPQYQYVFSPMGGKTPILRDSTFDSETGAPTSAGRLYYTSDANTNVTGLVDASGQVVERYVYSAYGNVTFCGANWAPLTSGGTNTTTTPGVSSAVGNTTLYASMVLDPRTGLFYDEARWYDACTSVFVSMDPAMADSNLYRYCGNDPIILVDPSGQVSLVIDQPSTTLRTGWSPIRVPGLSGKYEVAYWAKGPVPGGPEGRGATIHMEARVMAHATWATAAFVRADASVTMKVYARCGGHNANFKAWPQVTSEHYTWSWAAYWGSMGDTGSGSGRGSGAWAEAYLGPLDVGVEVSLVARDPIPGPMPFGGSVTVNGFAWVYTAQADGGNRNIWGPAPPQIPIPRWQLSAR